MVEANYYEEVADWRLERHLQSKDELRRFDVTASLISSRAESLLDVGTGNGAFLSLLEARGHSLHLCGLERSRAAIGASRCHSSIVEGSIDALPFEDRSFDTVTALEVIEHLPHGVYRAALAEMARVAREQVLISVPYRERRLMVDCPECGCRFSPIFHLRTFDEESFDHLVPGFRLTRTAYVSTDVHWLLTDLAEWIRAWRDKVRGTIRVASTCPQCGYGLRPMAVSAGRAAEVSGPQLVKGLRAAILSKVPKVKRAHWIVASYERCS